MEITKLEKAALITTGAAAAYKTLLWSLEASVTANDTPMLVLRVIFAALSFVAFDLVIMAAVSRGRQISGIAALIVASGVSGAIGLEVAGVVTWPALHAAPAITLAAFGLHLMLSRPNAAPEQPGSVTNNTQINVGVPLPRTFAEFAAARAAERPDATPAQLALEMGTSESTVRRLLDRVALINSEQGE